MNKAKKDIIYSILLIFLLISFMSVFLLSGLAANVNVFSDSARNQLTDINDTSITSEVTGSDTGTDTGSDTGSDTGTDTGTDTASYYINNTNFNKQYTIKNLNNGRGKKPFGNHQIRFGNDKDYSEPL